MPRLDEITGVGRTAAEELIAEIGPDAPRFTTPAHLVPWAKCAPIDHNSPGRTRGGTTGKGNPWLAATLGEVVVSVSRTNVPASVIGAWHGAEARNEPSSRSAS